MKRRRLWVPAVVMWVLSAHANELQPQLCTDDPDYGLSDFWVGEWVVYAGGDQVDENRIEKILNGCAVAEFWVASDGGEGQSLFFIDTNGHWQQVWVTEWAADPGGVKEKSLVEAPDGAVRFQGQISHPRSGSYLDRTTLTPMGDGAVHQLIEISTDAGKTWRSTFDAIYTPVQ